MAKFVLDALRNSLPVPDALLSYAIDYNLRIMRIQLRFPTTILVNPEEALWSYDDACLVLREAEKRGVHGAQFVARNRLRAALESLQVNAEATGFVVGEV
jgi:hypothetical protein